MLANGTASTYATFETLQGTYEASIKSGITIAAYTTKQANDAVDVITWGTTATTCDTTKWDTATACNGVDAPWASTSYVDWTVATTGLGSVKAWHFLAEKNADITKNFQIEKDNKINWIV